MTQSNPCPRGIQRSSHPDIESLAGRALARLKTQSLTDQADSSDIRIGALARALIDSDESGYQSLVLKFIAEGVRSEVILDDYIPIIARKLGQEWLDDGQTFADVTVGLSRLQQTVRSLGTRHEKDCTGSPVGHRVLLILPPNEQHSIGSMIVANQLRRLGLWVQMALDVDTARLCTLVKDQDLSMIGISIGTRQSLDNLPQIVKAVRGADTGAPIVAGGQVAVESRRQVVNSGVDFVASTAKESLALCGIDASASAITSHARLDA